MELKSLITGLALSVGIFAVKSGAGLSYLLIKEKGWVRRTLALAAFAVSYGLVFLLAWLVVTRFDILAYLDRVMLFFKHGMPLHLLLAALLLLWGIFLLKKKPESAEHSHGWLLLTLPCPVCFSVILFSGGFLHTLFPEESWLFGRLFVGFFSVAILSALVFALSGKGQPEHSLGAAMMLAALYFLITVAVVPQFTDIERIYRISKSSVTVLADKRLPLLPAGFSLLFLIGFFHSFRRSSWK